MKLESEEQVQMTLEALAIRVGGRFSLLMGHHNFCWTNHCENSFDNKESGKKPQVDGASSK